MDLDTVRAAINDIERDLKKVANKIEYRERVIRNTQAEIAELRRDREDLVDRYTVLVAQERELKEGEE